MCELIARAFSSQLSARFLHLATSGSEWLLEDDVRHLYQPQDDYIQQEIGQDYYQKDACGNREITQLE